MRALAIGVAVAAVLFLATGGHFILIPLLFASLGLLSLRRVRERLAGVTIKRPLNSRQPLG